MEREANYVAVGAFILLVIGMAVVFLIWYSDANDGRDYDLYEIYFAGSVSGLDRGSPVRYLGVDMGRVRRLSIDPEHPGRVVVVVEVDRSAPISSATRASLGLLGVTGLLYVDLKEVPDVARTKKLKQGTRYPIIESVASDFDAFVSSLPELMSRANSLFERVSRVLSDDNLKGVADTLANLRAASAGLPQTARNVDRLVGELRSTVNEINTASQSLRGISEDARPEIRTTLTRLAAASENLAKASERVDLFTATSGAQLSNFSEQGLFELQRLVRETRAAASEFRELSRTLKQNPSQILYEPSPSGVEIKP